MSRIPIIGLLFALTGCASSSEPMTINGSPVLNPSGSKDAVDTIDRPGQASVLMTTSESEVGLGVFQAKTGQPYLTMRDVDGDGVFDLFTYSSLTSTGEVLVDVEDHGMDGQADFVIDRKEQSARVFYRNAWYSVDGVGSGRPSTVNVGGKVLLLEDVLDEIGRGAF